MTDTITAGAGMIPPFVLLGSNRVWHIISGAVDVFLVDLIDREPTGARRHVRRSMAGEVLCGLPAEACERAGLLAVPLPGCTVECLDRAGIALPLLEKWIDGLSQAVSRYRSPNAALQIEPGFSGAIDDRPRALRTKNGLCWVNHRLGTSAFLGMQDLAPVNGDAWFPLSSAAWLAAQPGSVLEAIDSAAWIEIDPQTLGLDLFHRLALEVLLRERTEADRKERQRLAAAGSKEAGAVGSALRLLATPLDADAGELDAGEDADAGELLLACNAVGKEMGIRLRAPRGMRGTERIEDIARASGIRLRRVALRGDWWKRNSGPMVGFLVADGRPVALLSRGGRYRVLDAREDQTTRCGRDAAARLQGFAWVFYRPFPERVLKPWDLLQFGLRGAGRDLAAIVLVGVGSGLLGVLTPVATGLIFDQLIPGADRTGLAAAAGFLAMAAVVIALFSLTSSYAVLRLTGRMDAALQAAVWDRLLGLPVPFFRDYTSGDLAMRSLGISEIREALMGSTISSILSGIFSVFSLALMFYYSWPLALLGALLSFAACLVPSILGRMQLRHYRVLVEVRGKVSGLLLQFIGGIAKLRVAGKELRAFSVWAGEFTRQKREAAAVRKLSNILAIFTAVFPLVCTGAVFYFNSTLPAGPKGAPLSTGQFLAFHAAFFGFLSGTLELSWAAVSAASVVPLFERARPILAAVPEVESDKAEPGPLTGQIEVSQVLFRYRPDAPLVLRGLSLTVQPGEFVALVGASGCGKSTLFRLLLGFEKPEGGAVYFDGQDLSGLHLPAVRRQIGVVLQNGTLQSGDILHNIIGALPLTIDDAWEAATLAGLADDIRRMPMQMHTVIAEGGGGLSGGQRQRLMIARAIVAKPRIVLFDEATSALDNQTQAIVGASLEALRATRIVIAHRLSTILRADRVCVIDAGVVAEAGTYEELLRRNGLFSKLARRQMI